MAKNKNETSTTSDDFNIDAYMADFDQPIITVAQPTEEGWYPATIKDFRINYGMTGSKPKFPADFPTSVDGLYSYIMVSINCQTASQFARLAAKRDTDPYFSIEQSSKKNPACEGINLNIVVKEHIGIDIKNSLGFLNFIGGLLLPTGLITGDGTNGYQLSPELLQVLYSGVKATEQAIIAKFEETGRWHEEDRKNHASLVPAMLAEYQLNELIARIVDPTGESTITKLVCQLGIKEHHSGDGRKENFAKAFRYWYEIADSVQQDSHGTVFTLVAKGKEQVIDLLV